MNNQPIGFLDSGVGGLSIWQEVIRQLPHESTVYIADTKNVPYGNRSPEEIYQLAHRLVQFLIDKNCKLIVIACNTITVTCLDKLRIDFPHTPIIGIVPVVKTAAAHTPTKKIGILSTVRTSQSDYQQHLIKEFASDCEVFNIGTDQLVPFVERGETIGDAVTQVLQKELKVFIENNVPVIALGCSHFPFLKATMQNVLGPDVKLLDSSGAIARQVHRVLEQNNALASGSANHILFTTGDQDAFTSTVQKILPNTTAAMTHVEI